MVAKRQIAARALRASGVGAVLRLARAWSGLLVLGYHRIGDGGDGFEDPGLWSATPQDFDQQLRLIRRHAEVIGPDDLTDVLGRGGRGRFVLITLDDGYRDNFEQAFPILRAHGLRATFFVSTGFIDEPRMAWWDEIAWMVRHSRRDGLAASAWIGQVPFDPPRRQQAIDRLITRYKMLPSSAGQAYLQFLAHATGSGRGDRRHAARTWMTWDMLRAMQSAGMSIGGHTASHPILSRLPRAQQMQEIAQCRQRLEDELGRPMRWFSYPRGKPDAFTDETRQCLMEQGVQFAFAAFGGVQRLDAWDPYALHRCGVDSNIDLTQFRAMLSLPQIFAR